jgi:hypothetical protein
MQPWSACLAPHVLGCLVPWSPRHLRHRRGQASNAGTVSAGESASHDVVTRLSANTAALVKHWGHV